MANLKPKTLSAGSVIRIVASCSPFSKPDFLKGVRLLESWGFKAKYQKNIFSKDKNNPYLAGSDQRRASELITALEDKGCDAILFARGGYGSMRLLPYLDKISIPKKQKLIIGYSDITCLLNYFEQRFKWNVFYGPVVAKDLHAKANRATLQSFKNCLSQNSFEPIQVKNLKVLQKGKATGRLTGGCLSLIHSTLGTKYELETKGKILFLEDVNEKPYEIDRMLTHLKLAGKFKNVKGLIFSLYKPNPDAHYIATLKDILSDVKVPTVFNFPAGHTKVKHCLPFGVRVELDAGEKKLSFLESITKIN
jgi:muramoyltetrapeptide carboxypeptidase